MRIVIVGGGHSVGRSTIARQVAAVYALPVVTLEYYFRVLLAGMFGNGFDPSDEAQCEAFFESSPILSLGRGMYQVGGVVISPQSNLTAPYITETLGEFMEYSVVLQCVTPLVVEVLGDRAVLEGEKALLLPIQATARILLSMEPFDDATATSLYNEGGIYAICIAGLPVEQIVENIIFLLG